MAHPEGFHKNQAARDRCWGCSHPERLEVSPEDAALGRQLVAEGWLSTSNKYRLVGRVLTPQPPAAAVAFAPGVPRWLQERVLDAYKYWSRSGARHDNNSGVEQRALTYGQFQAFKDVGGQSA